MPHDIWSPLGMLAVAVLILFLAYWVTKRLGTIQMRGGIGRAGAGGAGEFRILAQISVGRNERLVLVRLQEKCCLLGVTAGQITLLKELEGDEAKEWLTEAEQSTPPSFAEVLKENLWKRK